MRLENEFHGSFKALLARFNELCSRQMLAKKLYEYRRLSGV